MEQPIFYKSWKKIIIMLLTMDLDFVSQAIHEGAPLSEQKTSLHSGAESESKKNSRLILIVSVLWLY